MCFYIYNICSIIEFSMFIKFLVALFIFLRCSNIVETFLNLDLEQNDLALFLENVSASPLETKLEEN